MRGARADLSTECLYRCEPRVRAQPRLALQQRDKSRRNSWWRHRAVAALASFSLLAFPSLGVLDQRLLTQLVGSRRFRGGQRPGRWSAPDAETLDKDTQALHA